MEDLKSMLETLMESGISVEPPACQFSDLIDPELKHHMSLVYKYYINEKFRENVTEGFLKLPNEIFMKSDERAERYRKKGNELYNKNNYQESLRAYNEAVAVASWESRPSDGLNTELTLAFSNRSMCLLKLNRYQEALVDIDLALAHVSTEQLTKKLNYRRNECLNHLKSSTIIDKKQESPLVSKITWNEKMTSAVACEPLNQLDLVFQENPELSLLRKDFYFTRCFNCFEQFDLIIPCRGCNQVKFCSYQCSLDSWNSGHHHFCHFLSLFDHLKNKEIFKIPPLLACQSILQLDTRSTFKSIREGNLPEMIRNISISTIEADKLDKMAETAAHLLTYFTVIKRLPIKNDSVPWRYDIELFGGLLLMYLRKVELDGRLVNSTELAKPFDPDEFYYLDDKVTGYAIYKQLKQLPHNCDPNVTIGLFKGRTVNLRAIRQINQGEPIQLDYGVNCKLFTLKERSNFLTNFGLKCNCDSCVQLVQPRAKCYLCPVCSGPVLIEDETNICLNCSQVNLLNRDEINIELDACLYNYRQANLALINREPDIIKAEDYLLDCYRKLRKICYPTNHNLTNIFDRLSYCYKKLRKYKLSLIYSERAVNCFNESNHILDRLRVNCFFNLLDRQRNFLIWCNKLNQFDSPEFQEIYNQTKQSIEMNLNEAHRLIVAIDFKLDYYHSIINKIETDLKQYNLIL